MNDNPLYKFATISRLLHERSKLLRFFDDDWNHADVLKVKNEALKYYDTRIVEEAQKIVATYGEKE